jgi:hypothetical protein
VIPAAGGVSSSVLWITTVWEWALELVDVNVREVPPGGVVESEQPVTPKTSRARKAAPAATARILFSDMSFLLC